MERKTCTREYVLYELQKSHLEGKGILGIYIHNIKDQYGQTDYIGANPLNFVEGNTRGIKIPLSDYNYKTYDWILDDGYHNMGNWIEEAARDASRKKLNPPLNY